MSTRYLVVIYTVTAGLHGDDLGSDEAEIVQLTWAVVDIQNCKVVAVHSVPIKPRSADLNDNGLPLLSDVARNTFAIKEEEDIKSSTHTFESAVDELESFTKTNLHSDDGRSFVLITDGQLHLRQVVHPEACRKSFPLPHFFYSFFDLRKEFDKFYSRNLFKSPINGNHHNGQQQHQTSSPSHSSTCNSISTTPSILNGVLTPSPPSSSSLSTTSMSTPSSLSTSPSISVSIATSANSTSPDCQIQEMLHALSLEADASAELAIQAVSNMSNIIIRMILDGHKFESPEEIHDRLEPGVCTRDDIVDSNTIVRARGLPWQSSDQDIAKFFRGLNIVKGGVALCLSPQGRRNGEALVRFSCPSHRDLALKRHKHHIANRYIEVYRATGEDFLNVAGGHNNEAQAFLSRGGQVIVRMRGLPYDCTAQQVMDFFSSGGVKSSSIVMHGEEGVLFVKKSDGRSTGDAFVLFDSEEVASRALTKHRDLIGTRYIELFRSSTAEVQQVLNRTMSNDNNQRGGGLAAPSPYLNGHHHHQHHDANHHQISNGVSSGSQSHSSNLTTTTLSTTTPNQHHINQPAAAPLLSNLPPPLPPPQVIAHQQLIPSGHRIDSRIKDCIRLRGLPYEAQVEQILEFLGEHSKNIVFQGVHMVYNAQGQPSGEAFIQMDSEQSAATAALTKHNKYMSFGKKQRYIEVFQCSIDDMNLVLTGGVPIQRSLLAASYPGILHPNYGAYTAAAAYGPNAAHQVLSSVVQPGTAVATAAAVTAAAAAAARAAAVPATGYYPFVYWPYPSPPISPTTYYAP